MSSANPWINPWVVAGYIFWYITGHMVNHTEGPFDPRYMHSPTNPIHTSPRKHSSPTKRCPIRVQRTPSPSTGPYVPDYFPWVLSLIRMNASENSLDHVKASLEPSQRPTRIFALLHLLWAALGRTSLVVHRTRRSHTLL